MERRLSGMEIPVKLEDDVLKLSSQSSYLHTSDTSTALVMDASGSQGHNSDHIGEVPLESRHMNERPTIFKCNYCKRTSLHEQDMAWHFRKHKIPYKCKICTGNRVFRLKIDFAKHLVNHSLTNFQATAPFKCSICERTFPRLSELIQHTQLHTEKLHLKCNLCEILFLKIPDLVTHLMTHALASSEVPAENIGNLPSVGNEEPINKDNLEINVSCSEGNYIDFSQVGGAEQQNEWHAMEEVSNEVIPHDQVDCEVNESNGSVIQRTERDPLVVAEEAVREVKQEYNEELELSYNEWGTSHLSTVIDIKTENCEISYDPSPSLAEELNGCSYSDSLRDFSLLQTSLPTRRGRKPQRVSHFRKQIRIYKCNTCERGFKKSGDWAKHVVNHSLTNFQTTAPFKCFVCHGTFPSLILVMHHARLHKENILLQCNVCEQFFQKRSELWWHLVSQCSKRSKDNCDATHFSIESDKSHDDIHLEMNAFSLTDKRFITSPLETAEQESNFSLDNNESRSTAAVGNEFISRDQMETAQIISYSEGLPLAKNDTGNVSHSDSVTVIPITEQNSFVVGRQAIKQEFDEVMSSNNSEIECDSSQANIKVENSFDILAPEELNELDTSDAVTDFNPLMAGCSESFKSDNICELPIVGRSKHSKNVEKNCSSKQIRIHKKTKKLKCIYCKNSKECQLGAPRREPYKCYVCIGFGVRSRVFKLKSDLIKHLVNHSLTNFQTTSPYRCYECDSMFRSTTLLLRHLRTHLNHVPVKCNVCKCYFSKASVLATHLWTHSLRSFKCFHCDIEFKNMEPLTRHLKKKHASLRKQTPVTGWRMRNDPQEHVKDDIQEVGNELICHDETKVESCFEENASTSAEANNICNAVMDSPERVREPFIVKGEPLAIKQEQCEELEFNYTDNEWDTSHAINDIYVKSEKNEVSFVISQPQEDLNKADTSDAGSYFDPLINTSSSLCKETS